MKETEKNFLICAVLMIVCGVGLLFMTKQIWGILCIIVGLLFAGVGIYRIIKGKNEE